MPVVVLPGMDGTGDLLTDFVQRLSHDRPVQLIRYPVDRPLGYEQLTAYVASQLPQGPFVIIAESFSGPIAIEIAAAVPRVAGLVLASSFARHPLPRFLAPLARLVDLAVVPGVLVRAVFLGSKTTPELAGRLTQVLATVPREIIRARAHAVLRIDKRDRLRAVRCPILCLQGQHDRLVRRPHVKTILQVQPGTRVEWLDAAHMLLETQPDLAAEAIGTFCRYLLSPVDTMRSTKAE